MFFLSNKMNEKTYMANPRLFSLTKNCFFACNKHDSYLSAGLDLVFQQLQKQAGNETKANDSKFKFEKAVEDLIIGK